MPDRIQVLIAVPTDDALPIDVQAIGLRRRAIELMQEIATIDENTVRYKGATTDATVLFGGEIGTVSTWQLNLIAARFTADGHGHKEVGGPIVYADRTTRFYSATSFERDLP